MSSQQMPRRAKALLNTMVMNRQITSAGLDWLTIATDPFHDTEVNPTGFPDADCSRSIPQLYQFTASCSAPPGLDTPTWDAHLDFCPISYVFQTNGTGGGALLYRHQVTSEGVFGLADNGVNFVGGYNLTCCSTGANIINGIPAVVANNMSVGFPRQACIGQFRLVACGVEVVNTTPELYRGGTVTCYRSPSSFATKTMSWTPPATSRSEKTTTSTGSSTHRVDDTPPTLFAPIDVCALPPGTTTDAQLYPSSRTWGAEDGCYLVGTMCRTSNNYDFVWPSFIAATNMITDDSLTEAGSTYAFAPIATGLVSPSVQPRATSQSCTLPFDWHGAIFSGLSPQTTLQVSVRYYVERIPTIQQPELLVLTREPTPHDPTALEIYSRALSQLPVGVRVSENPLGEWFNDIMDMVATWAPRIGTGLSNFIPGGAAIGNAVGSGAAALSRLNRPAKPDASVQNKQPRKPRQQQQQQQQQQQPAKPSGRSRRRRNKKPS